MSDLDRKLHEMMGKIWHEPRMKHEPQSYACMCGFRHCHEVNPSYLEWENYGELLQWCKRQDRLIWSRFVMEIGHKGWITAFDLLLDPARGCEAIANFDWGKK